MSLVRLSALFLFCLDMSIKTWASDTTDPVGNSTGPFYGSTTTFFSGNLGEVTVSGSTNKSLAFHVANRPNAVKEAAGITLNEILQKQLDFTGDETILPTDHDLEVDKQGNVHVRFKQYINDLPLEGASMMLHMSGKDGTVYALNGEFHSALAVDTSPAALECETAVDMAWSEVLTYSNISASSEWKSECEEAAVQGRDGKPHLAFKRLRGYQPPGEGAPYQRDVIFASRTTGALVAVHPKIVGARALKTYDCQSIAVDTPSQCILVTTSPNKVATSDAILNEAHNNAVDVYDFYKNLFNRDSMDNNGLTIQSLVHYDAFYNNAFFTELFDGLLVYGDGDGFFYDSWTKFDVVAHEFSHGVTFFSSNLVYESESGALNEAFSDCMAAAAERVMLNKSPADVWLLAEDVDIFGWDGVAIRNMQNPPEYGDPDHYADRYTGTEDNGGVHTNSGIMNKAFTLITQGGTHPKSNIIVPALNSNFDNSIKAAAKIFYDANTKCLTESSDYQAVRECTLLFASSTQTATVSKAWDAVGVKGDLPLTNGVPKTGISLPFDKDYQVYLLDQQVSVGQTVSCQLQGSNGDPDLSVRFGRRPALYPNYRDNDCYSASPDATEECTTNPATASFKVYVAVEAFFASTGVTLQCQINELPGSTRSPTKAPVRPPTKPPTRKPTKAPTRQPIVSPPSCQAKNSPCTSRTDCCARTPALTCDAPPNSPKICKVCKRRLKTCSRSSQCCLGLKCKSGQCK